MKPGNKNSYKSLTSIEINQNQYNFYSLKLAEQNGLKGIEKLPKSLKVLLENLLRYEDGKTVTKNQILALQNISPAPAAIIFSLEGVFGSVAAWIILDQYLNEYKILGIIIILSAVIFSQLAPLYDKRRYGRN